MVSVNLQRKVFQAFYLNVRHIHCQLLYVNRNFKTTAQMLIARGDTEGQKDLYRNKYQKPFQLGDNSPQPSKESLGRNDSRAATRLVYLIVQSCSELLQCLQFFQSRSGEDKLYSAPPPRVWDGVGEFPRPCPGQALEAQNILSLPIAAGGDSGDRLPRENYIEKGVEGMYISPP